MKSIGYNYAIILRGLPLVSRCGLGIRSKQASKIAPVDTLIAYIANGFAATLVMRILGLIQLYDYKCAYYHAKQEEMVPKAVVDRSCL